jgi:Zn-finger nucleic acid-binding protein
LAARDYLDFAVEECDPCGGLFLAPSMLDRLVKARDQSTGLRLALPKRQRVAETTVRYLECPVCSKPMNRQAFGRISGIVVDLCKLHGVWFDPGELTQVLEFIQNGGLERARIREGEERADELRRLRATQAEAVTLRDLGAQPATVEPDFLRFAQELARSLAELWRAR